MAAVAGNEAILTASLDEALLLLGEAPVPMSIKVYRQEEIEGDSLSSSRSAQTVQMSPRRLPSTKKLLKASTSASFWKDPVMLSSAVLTVLMPLGIYIASSLK